MNYYEILEISPEANAEEIKKSYRKLAMKYHPDRNDGTKEAEEKFKKINEAYSILSDPSKKQEYDYSLTNGFGQNDFNSQHYNMHDFFSHSFDEIFKNFGFQHEFQSRAKSFNVTLNFWEAAIGCEKSYEFSLNTANGKKRVKFNVQFPPATDSGDTIALQVEEQLIHLHVNVLDDLSFERDNLDIYTILEIPFTTGILGGKTIFPHWSKDLEINIPAGIDNGTKIRVANMGIKKNIHIGDLYLVIKLVTPKKLNKKQKELLTEFAALDTKKENAFNQSLKKLWSSIFKK